MFQQSFSLNKIGLKSLSKLCENTAVHEQLVELFFAPESKLLKAMDNLLSHEKSALSAEILKLYCELQKLNVGNPLLAEDKKCTLQLKIFSINKQLATQAAHFIIDSGENLWDQTVFLFVNYEVCAAN